jgi:hypothetical protein
MVRIEQRHSAEKGNRMNLSGYHVEEPLAGRGQH